MARCRSLVLVLIVALPVASAAGCDGDEETSQTEAPAPTRQEFVAQADAICRAAEQDLRATEEDLEDASVALGRRGDEKAEAEFVEDAVIPHFQRKIDGIRELTPPPGEEEKLEAALSAAERDLHDYLQPDLIRVPKGMQELNRQLESYGSKACVN